MNKKIDKKIKKAVDNFEESIANIIHNAKKNPLEYDIDKNIVKAKERLVNKIKKIYLEIQTQNSLLIGLLQAYKGETREFKEEEYK